METEMRPGTRVRVIEGAETGTTGYLLYTYDGPKGPGVVISTVAGFELTYPASAVARD